MSYDDCLLVSAGEDGSVVLMDIRDKELAKVSTRQQQVGERDGGARREGGGKEREGEKWEKWDVR